MRRRTSWRRCGSCSAGTPPSSRASRWAQLARGPRTRDPFPAARAACRPSTTHGGAVKNMRRLADPGKNFALSSVICFRGPIQLFSKALRDHLGRNAAPPPPGSSAASGPKGSELRRLTRCRTPRGRRRASAARGARGGWWCSPRTPVPPSAASPTQSARPGGPPSDPPPSE